jgi:hypothetical protein
MRLNYRYRVAENFRYIVNSQPFTQQKNRKGVPEPVGMLPLHSRALPELHNTGRQFPRGHRAARHGAEQHDIGRLWLAEFMLKLQSR